MAATSNRTKMGGNFVFEVSNSASIMAYLFLVGTVHILRKQAGWVGGVDQMLTFSYKVGGWIIANT